MYDICCIGHITKDKVINNKGEFYMAGGTAYYFANALQKLPVKFNLITAVGKTEAAVVADLHNKNISVKAIPSAHSVFFENIYTDNQDHRTQRVLQKATPFTTAAIADIDARIFHLGPLLADDISLDIIKSLYGRGIISLDVQGFLREVQSQNVIAVDWLDKKEALKHISILKANEFELEVLTGCADIEEGAKVLYNWGVKEAVITLGSKGSVIYADSTFYHIPAYVPTNIVDATGCGDTYMAGYLYQRVKGANIQYAGEFAAAMASLKIEATGPFAGTEDDVLQLLKKHKS